MVCNLCTQVVPIREFEQHLFEECQNKMKVTGCDKCGSPVEKTKRKEQQ